VDLEYFGSLVLFDGKVRRRIALRPDDSGTRGEAVKVPRGSEAGSAYCDIYRNCLDGKPMPHKSAIPEARHA